MRTLRDVTVKQAMRFAPLILAFAAAATVGVSASHATRGRSNGLILFYSEPTGGRHEQLFTVRPDGSQLRQLTHFTNSDADHASWSADGSRIVFERDFPNRAVIETMSANGGRLVVLTPRGLQGMPAYAPDGRTIVFDRTLPKEDALWLMRANGTGLRQLTHNKAARTGECRCESSPVFSPDGTRIAFVRHITDTQTAVFVVNRDGSGLKQLTPWRFGVSDKVDWAPDGTKILLSSPPVERSHLASNIYTIAPDGTRLTQLTHETTPDVQDVAECFSPDGTKVVFARTVPGRPYQLFVMNADGTGETPLVHRLDAHWANWSTHS